MPELPDVTVYVERLEVLTRDRPLDNIRIASVFVLRTFSPAPKELFGAKVTSVERLGKRIVIGVEGGRFIVIHLMIAGRLRWRAKRASGQIEKVPNKVGLAAFS